MPMLAMISAAALAAIEEAYEWTVDRRSSFRDDGTQAGLLALRRTEEEQGARTAAAELPMAR